MKFYYDPIMFNQTLDGVDSKRHIVGTYYLEDPIPGEDPIDHFSLVQSLAVEGSTGTWEEVKAETTTVTPCPSFHKTGRWCRSQVRMLLLQARLHVEGRAPRHVSALLVVLQKPRELRGCKGTP